MYALNVDNMDIKLLNPLTLATWVLDADVREYIVLKLQSKLIDCIKFRKVMCLRKVRRKL